MPPKEPISAVFIGDGSLLLQCAEAFRQAGHTILAVVSGNPAHLDWARAQGLREIAMDGDWPAQLDGLAFDYLFSVANLRLLPAAVLQRARVLAVNFHDALLPRYAGLNATCWALMAQETVHGISWHEMTAQADAGRIVRQASFEVSPAETAFSLNAKCWEAGLAAFRAIVADLSAGPLALAPQRGERQLFRRDQRPALLGTLELQRPARALAALVRALDHGNYANPLGLPKLLLGDGRLLLVRSAEVEPTTGEPAGTVLSVDGQHLRIATGDGVLALGGCMTPDGRPGMGGLRVGDRLPVSAGEAAALLQERLSAIGRGEAHWLRMLGDARPVELPHPRRNAGPGGPVRLPLGVAARGATTLAALQAWLAALTGQSRVALLCTDATLQRSARPLATWLSAWVPVASTLEADTTVDQANVAADAALAQAHAAGPMPHDLPLRLGERSTPWPALSRIALALAPAQAPAGCELLVVAGEDGSLELQADGQTFAPETVLALATQLTAWLRAFPEARGPLRTLPLLTAQDREVLDALNATTVPFARDTAAHAAIAEQALRTPQQPAVATAAASLTHAQLQAQSDALAHHLVARGVQPGDIVGLALPRTPQLLVALLAVWKAGAAYLPLDPEYPRERLQFMVRDAQAPLVLCDAASEAALALQPAQVLRLDQPAEPAPVVPLPAPEPVRPAYVIYTSGSTGTPKGVVVTHRNVMNFFAGMDARVPHGEGARWLAVTSLSFDISVLELAWTLARGITVVLHTDNAPAPAAPEFSLFYFASDEGQDHAASYRLLFEGAKFADREGFGAVWTPERHFHAFGGLYPNPVVTSAALAACTSRIQIRAGSCVLPLHHPVRVAEDWAFVDNISGGRVGLSVASGWQPNDFVLQPQAFARRQDELIERLQVVRRLWRGEAVPFPGPKGTDVPTRTLPPPVQKEIPVWLTAAGNPKTFEAAGQHGCRLLTHLLGQKVEDVAAKIRLYRQAWRAAGHPGDGHVTLMLHTFVADTEDEAREVARGPMKSYLRSAMDLVKAAAWTFPTFVQRAAADGRTPLEIMESAPLSAQEQDALLEHAFQRYYGTSALIGDRERCLRMVDQVQAAGVDEIACLVDFGIAPDTVLAHLSHLKGLMDATRAPRASAVRVSVPDNILRHGVTHLQCTPSMASMLLADATGRSALARLQALLVGGEALPSELAAQLCALVPGALLNMYGPTETTVWSTTAQVDRVDGPVPLGTPIANTRLGIRSVWGQELPALVPGELWIGGAGVTAGYLHRPELTAQRFVADASGQRWYRTGDLVRRLPDGTLEFLGRLDHQVKLRGHRIELGEIESALLRQDGVRQAVVVARSDGAGGQLLAGYVTARPGARLDADALREALAAALPAIMVPAAVLVLPQLPMTPNGKVDRAQLPDARVATAARPLAAPGDPMEATIAGIWRDVLGLAQVGTTDNFFDLGGHSLAVVQVQRRLREATGAEVAITDMFRLTTIRALAGHLAGGAASTAVSQGQSRAQQRRALRGRQLQTT